MKTTRPDRQFPPLARRAIPTTALLPALVGSVLAIEGCAKDPVSIETSAAGQPAQIVMTNTSHAGGREYREETRIDSAAGRYTFKICHDAPIAVACTTPKVVREGAVLPNILQELFAATTRPAFRALNPSYPGPPGVTPPDGGSATLEVVRNGSKRTVTWASAAYLPAALVDFQCLLRAARGDLLLCD